MAKSDAELVGEILAGKLDSFTDLFSRYEMRIRRYALSIVKKDDDADDVTQLTFVKAYRNLRAYDQKRPFSAWLYRITHNEALNFLRSHKRHVTGEVSEQVINSQPAEDDSPHREIEKKELRELVQKSLESLPLKYREPLTLYFLEEQSYEEISDILRIPVSTVGTRISRGKKYLKGILEQK